MSSGPSSGWRRVDPRRDGCTSCSGAPERDESGSGAPKRDESKARLGPSGPVRCAIVREEALVRCEPCLDGGRNRPIEDDPWNVDGPTGGVKFESCA